MKAISFTFDNFDFVIGSFQSTGADRVVHMVQDAIFQKLAIQGNYEKPEPSSIWLLWVRAAAELWCPVECFIAGGA